MKLEACWLRTHVSRVSHYFKDYETRSMCNRDRRDENTTHQKGSSDSRRQCIQCQRLISARLPIGGQWKAVKLVGSCNCCGAPGRKKGSFHELNDPEFEVFELNIVGHAPQLCEPCLQSLAEVVALGKREKVLGTEQS